MLVDSPCILGINPDHETWIWKTMHNDWGICHPHEFQIRAIHQAAFTRDELLCIIIIAKTGSGKSAIPLTVGTLLTGVVITLVPLVGLGSNQVSKSCNAANYVKAYHINEHHRKDAKKLRYHLDAMTAREADYVTIFLNMSPESLQIDSPFYGVICRIANKNFLWLVLNAIWLFV
jgi:superfamily II DNA helicase RecQ